MYRDFFGLKKSPFKITPDPALFYSGGKRGEILEALVYSIESGAGITKVVGEVGSGKTMLCRMLESRLPKNISIVYIANPSLSAENILQMIAFELGLTLVTASKLEAMQELHKWLLKQHAQARQVVVFIEEAQCMPIETLEEIRLLSNLETNEDKLLQIVLFGQPELDKNLSKPEIRQLKDRISNAFQLTDLKPDEIEGYLKHRMEKAGYRGPFIFSSRAVKLIGKYSKGLIRRVNILADKALLAAFSDGQHIVKAKHVNLAGIDSQFKDKGSISKTQLAIYSVVFTALFSSAVTYSFMAKNKTPLSQNTVAQVEQQPKKEVLAEKTLVKNKAGSQSLEKKNSEEKEIVVQKKAVEQKNNRNIDKPLSNEQSASLVKIEQAPKTIDYYLKKTDQWLINQDPNFTIQLLLNPESFKYSVNDYLQTVSSIINPDDIHVYEANIKGRTMYGVLYGNYPDKQSALQAISLLPEVIRRNDPFVRTVNSLKRKLSNKLASNK